MARKKKNRDINVFSASAIDLFASSMGVFIILVVVLFPYFGNKSKIELSKSDTESIKSLETFKTRVKKQEKVISSKNAKIKEIQKKLEQLTESVQSSSQNQNQQISSQQEKISELKKKLEDAQSQLSSNSSLEEILEKKNDTITKLETESNSKNKKISKLEQEIQSLKEVSQRALASVKDSQSMSTQVSSLQKALEAMKDEVKKQKASQANSSQTITDLKEKLEKEKSFSSSLEQKLKKNKGQVDGKSFLAVVMKWSTEKHDVDLVLKAPDGKVFDFKHKKYGNSYGEFVLDSRSGPGAEVWQSQQLTPGRYTLTSKLYNTYGNNKPAEVSASLFTKKGKMDIPAFQLSPKKKTNSVSFEVDKEGKIQFF